MEEHEKPIIRSRKIGPLVIRIITPASNKKPPRNTPINKDDITNLKILLNLNHSFDEFLEKI